MAVSAPFEGISTMMADFRRWPTGPAQQTNRNLRTSQPLTFVASSEARDSFKYPQRTFVKSLGGLHPPKVSQPFTGTSEHLDKYVKLKLPSGAR